MNNLGSIFKEINNLMNNEDFGQYQQYKQLVISNNPETCNVQISHKQEIMADTTVIINMKLGTTLFDFTGWYVSRGCF